MSADRITVKFSRLDSKDSHTVYKILAAENNETWELQARYKRLRELYKELKVRYGKESLPRFPPKKYFGSLGDSFVSQRQKGLEEFFNNVLKRYTLEDIGSLKQFLLDGRKTAKKTASQPEAAGDKNKNANSNTLDKKVAQQKGNDIEKIVNNIKKQFFDLNDNFEPKDEEDVSKKKHIYNNFKLQESNPGYNLPPGSESNLIYVHDPNIMSQHENISTLCESTLDNIHEALQKVKFYDGDIVVVP